MFARLAELTNPRVTPIEPEESIGIEQDHDFRRNRDLN
jgi:hypothetical protein